MSEQSKGKKEIIPKLDDFHPTLDQLAFAESYIRFVGNVTKACKEIGHKNRNIYYGRNGWYYNEKFRIWLQDYAQKRVLQHYGSWLLACERFALSGSYRHMELLLILAGRFHPHGINIKNAIINQVKDGNIIVGSATREFLQAIATATGSHITDVEEVKG